MSRRLRIFAGTSSARSGARLIAAGVTGALAASARCDWEDYTGALAPTGTGADAAAAFPEWDAHRSKVVGHETTTGVLAGVAVVGAIGGLIWLLSGDDEGEGAPASVGLVPTRDGLRGHAVWRF